MRVRLGRVSALIFFSLVGCQDHNSDSGDAGQYGPASAAFTAAKAVMATSCSSCHAYQSMSEDDLAAAGLLVKGDPSSSKLYYRLTGSTGSTGPKTMPQGAALAAGDVAKIHDWIAGISP